METLSDGAALSDTTTIFMMVFIPLSTVASMVIAHTATTEFTSRITHLTITTTPLTDITHTTMEIPIIQRQEEAAAEMAT